MATDPEGNPGVGDHDDYDDAVEFEETSVDVPSSTSGDRDVEGDQHEENRDNSSTKSTRTYECCICFDNFSSDGNVLGCTGSKNKHYQCKECEKNYLRTELAPGQAFDSRRWMGGGEESGLVSEPEQLPCPLFVPGECDCASMPLTGLCGILSESDDIVNLYHEAFRRVVEATVRKDLPSSVEGTLSATRTKTNAKTVQDVYRAVQDALDEASLMRCPDCGFPGLKDEACMHIRCEGPACSTSWCYCCGRHRKRGNNPEDCRGCDSGPWRLEEVPGWGNHALPGEHRGIGARNEFHRRRMLYYVQRIKKQTPDNLWESFRQEYPRILSGIPTLGRSITWKELDEPRAAIPPVFGNSTEEDLLWKLPPLIETAPDDDHGNNAANEQQQQEQLQEEFPPINEVIKSTQGLVWSGALALTLILLIVRWSISGRSPGLNVFTDLLVAVVAYCGFSFGLLRVADYRARNPTTSFSEAQFLGTNVDEPFLSQRGRWSDFRDIYVRVFVGGVALGSLLVGTSKNLSKLEVTCQVVGSIVLSCVLTDWSLLTLLVNVSNPPRENEEEHYRMETFRNLLRFLFSYSLFWSLGIGLLTSDSEPAKAAGKFFLSLGLAGMVAELGPRFMEIELAPRFPIWDEVDLALRIQSYALCVGLAVGPTLVSIGNSNDAGVAKLIGILVCMGIPVSLIWYCLTREN